MDWSTTLLLLLGGGAVAVTSGMLGQTGSDGAEGAEADQDPTDAYRIADGAGTGDDEASDFLAYRDDLAALTSGLRAPTGSDGAGLGSDSDDGTLAGLYDWGDELTDDDDAGDNLFDVALDPENPEGAAADARFDVYEITGPDAVPANIPDFDPATDSLHIQYAEVTDPDSGDPVPPDLSVTYNSFADITSVALDGTEIAALAGDVAITEDDITMDVIG
jgi:hypothetical protein